MLYNIIIAIGGLVLGYAWAQKIIDRLKHNGESVEFFTMLTFIIMCTWLYNTYTPACYFYIVYIVLNNLCEVIQCQRI